MDGAEARRFQGHNFFRHIGMDRNMRGMFAAHAYFERTAEFIEQYDNPAFNADTATLPIAEFAPMLRRVFAQPHQTIYKSVMQSPAKAGGLRQRKQCPRNAYIL